VGFLSDFGEDMYVYLSMWIIKIDVWINVWFLMGFNMMPEVIWTWVCLLEIDSKDPGHIYRFGFLILSRVCMCM